MEYNIKHEKLLTKRLKSSTIVNCNENKKLIEVINKMKDNKVYLTDEGFLELEEELNELKNVTGIGESIFEKIKDNIKL